MMELSISGIPTNGLQYIPLQGVTKVQNGRSAYTTYTPHVLFLSFVLFLFNLFSFLLLQLRPQD